MRRVVAALSLAALVLTGAVAVPAAAQASRFPSAPGTDVRIGTPNDPNFDCSESDDEDPEDDCFDVFAEQSQLFGFAPESTRDTAVYKDLDRFGEGQISGVRADRAWKTTIGEPEVVIAILDTGIRWNDGQLRTKIALRTSELPLPEGEDGYDADADGAVTVDDWAGDSRVDPESNGNGILDGQDLIRAFSNSVDDDGNGYVDDIAGWDFLNDDNDPSDDSSYSAANGHGSGRAREAGGATNDDAGDAAVCPQCRIMPLREWDSFVVPGDNYAAATTYLADNGASVQEVANGVIQNTAAAKAANAYAAERGVALMQVSSDLNTANHNYPTNYRESVYINGCVADTHGLGMEVPGLSGFLDSLGFGLDTQVPVQTWFRNSNLTQYGAHASVCYTATTGSAATGQAAGGAGLLVSRGREVEDAIGGELTSDEVKQLLTMTAEDVLPENTTGLGDADPAQEGFDEHFGYGRANLGEAVERIAPGTIPPEAWIDDPEWWAVVDPTLGPVPVEGHISAERSSGWSYSLQWATGVEPLDDAFIEFASGDGEDVLDGTLGALPLDDMAAALPGSVEGTPPTDPNEYVVTVRLVVTDGEDAPNRGEDRKTYHIFHDPTLHEGWPVETGIGGETSPVLYDLDGDGLLEVIDADSGGAMHVRTADGEDAPFFNRGRPFQLPPSRLLHAASPAYATGAVPPPTGGWRTPAVADIDGDLVPEIVATAVDGRLWVLERNGAVAPGFPVAVDPALSGTAVESRSNHVKRGFLAAPSVGDLDGDGRMEIVAAALDGHLYVWSATGQLRPGFPVHLEDPEVDEFYGGELIGTPALGDVDGDGDLEIVSASSEVYGPSGSPPDPSQGVAGSVNGLVTALAAGAAGGSSRLYVVEDDGTIADGWPVTLDSLLPDVLPFVGPQHVPALVDADDDPDDVEIVTSLTAGDVQLYDGDGSVLQTFASDGQGTATPGRVLNLFEYPVVGDLDGDGGVDVAKGGITIGGVVNLLLVGQNLPFDHVMQAWDAETGEYKTGFPAPIDDYQLISTPALTDVDDAAGSEILAASGLYLLHAYGALGAESAGFPKLTGGWTIGTAATGDIDGDGLLELASATREGRRLVWDLDAPAVADADWPTEAHDECHTNHRGTDCRPPARVRNLALRADGRAVTFTATGDDWLAGENTTYRVYASSSAFARPEDVLRQGRLVAEVSADSASGEDVSVTIPAEAPLVGLAVVALDDAGNVSLPALAGRGANTPTTPTTPATPSTAPNPPSPEPDAPTPTPTPTPTASPSPAARPGSRPTADPQPSATPTASPAPDALRAGGADRVATSAAVSRSAFTAADVAVLARADTYPDALAGAPLATTLAAPLLLTSPDELSGPTAAEIQRLGATRVILLGGEAALRPAVADALTASGLTVERVAGPERFATAARIRDQIGPTDEVLLVEGADPDPTRGWPDALSAAGAGATLGLPVLLTSTVDLPAATAAALEADDQVIVVGGPAAVGDGVLEDVRTRTGGVRRISGATRYGTSAAMADELLLRGVMPTTTWVATGLDWPDGLSAGAAVGHDRGVLLLVDARDLDASPPTRDWFGAHAAAVAHLRIAGGTSAISDPVLDRLRTVLGVQP